MRGLGGLKNIFSDLGKIGNNYLSFGGVLECLSPDLSAYLVIFKKNSNSEKIQFSVRAPGLFQLKT